VLFAENRSVLLIVVCMRQYYTICKFEKFIRMILFAIAVRRIVMTVYPEVDVVSVNS